MQHPLKPSRSQNHLNRTEIHTSISIVTDEKHTFRLPLGNLRTLTDLRTAIGKRSSIFTANDRFIGQKHGMIRIFDEKNMQIGDILDSTGTIHTRHYEEQHNGASSRVSSAQRFENSTRALLRDPYPVVNVLDISTKIWTEILENNAIFRGRIIRCNSLTISHRHMFHMKSGWKMNVYPKDKIEWRQFSTKD